MILGGSAYSLSGSQFSFFRGPNCSIIDPPPRPAVGDPCVHLKQFLFTHVTYAVTAKVHCLHNSCPRGVCIDSTRTCIPPQLRMTLEA